MGHSKRIKSGILTLFKITFISTVAPLLPTVKAMTWDVRFHSRSEIPDTPHSDLPRATPAQANFDWQKLTPSPDLVWVQCFAGRQCARLEVPLDYSAPSGNKAAVALLRIQAEVAPDSKNYRGPVLFNPGGPGGSGVDFVNQLGDEFQQILGGEYDIVGFDPRGIGQTTPVVSVFQDEAERAAWDAGAPPVLNSTVDALPRAFARALVFNALVEARSKRVAQHVSTAVVARDMLSITKAHGRDRLQYWGFSYGSVLGATYAAMFPENIERLIIDGVVDFDDYYSGLWSRSLIDTDKALQILYETCARAGASCPLHEDSADLVRQRVEAILASVKTQPVPVIDGPDYGVIDFTAVEAGLFLSVQSPFSVFPRVAAALATLEGGDGTAALALLRIIQPVPTCGGGSPPGPSPSPKKEGGLAVECGDAAHVANTTAEVMDHFEMLSKTSVFADLWTDDTFTPCAGWKVRVTERFAGPFDVHTSFPLLVIGNTADPITPLVGAQKAVRTFRGSALLTINTPGHTSSAANSSCAAAIVRDYFTDGKVPREGTVCEVDDMLFGVKFADPANSTVGPRPRDEAASLPCSTLCAPPVTI